MKGPEITKDEFNRALRFSSDKKSTGLDDIPSEILKNLDEKTEKTYLKLSRNAMRKALFRKTS